MTGQYPQRFGFEHNSGPEKFADPKFGLPKTVSTLAEKLKAAGYAAGIGGRPLVAVWNPLTGALHRQFFAYNHAFRGGVRVGVSDATGDGINDLLTGAGPGGTGSSPWRQPCAGNACAEATFDLSDGGF